MKTVKPASTLYYYDGPQVLEARDAIGGHYIAVMVERLTDYDRYLVAGVAPERLRRFRSGILDLRTLLVDADADEWYLASAPAGPEQLMTLEPQHRSLAESGLLPDEGFVLHDRPADELALIEARMRNNVVLEITADPPEAVDAHRIRIGTFTGLLNHVQTVVRHAYRAALREVSVRTRSRLHAEDAESEANSLVEILSGVSNLGSEPVTLVGEFERGNRGIGSWGLLTEDGIYSGKINESGPSLNGLKFGGHYKFYCVEEIEEIEATGRESRTLYLNAYEPV
jgi:hypothetical protein